MDLSIFDIFDDLQDSTVKLQDKKAASPERVKALTLARIHQEDKPAEKPRKFRLPYLAAAVLLIAAIATTAIATDGFGVADWFRDIFGNMSEKEQQAAESLTMDTEEPVTVSANGTSVTLVSAMGDARNCYARIRLEAPKGTKLPRESGQFSFLPAPVPPDYIQSSILTCPDLVSSRGFPFYDNIIWTDTVPEDNILEAVIQIGLPQDSRVSFTDDHPDFLSLSGLYANGDTGIHDTQKQLLEGPWQLPLAPMGGETRELEVLGKTCRFTAGGLDYGLTLRRMTVSPLGIEVDAVYDTPVSGEGSFTYPVATAYTMDGTPVHGTVSYDRIFQLEEQICSYSYIFDAPVALEDIDSIVFCDLMIPVSGDGSRARVPAQAIVGTHVKLGDPGSLRTGEDMPDRDSITADLSYEDYLRAASYADYTDKGIELIRPVGMGSGRLIYTLTDARLVDNLSQIGGSTAGFSPETFYVWGQDQWETGDVPTGINKDGSFREGYRLILLDVSVTNDHVTQTADSISPNNPSLNGFNSGGLFFLSTLESKNSSNISYMNSNYFMDAGGRWVNYFELAPGETRDVTVGFWLTPDQNWDLSTVRATNTSGWEHGVFIDLDLVP